MDIPQDAVMKVTGDFGATYEPAPQVLRAKASSTTIQRLADRRKSSIDRLFEHAEVHGEAVTLPSSAWSNDEVAGPNVTDKETVLSFARMANNAYTHDARTHVAYDCILSLAILYTSCFERVVESDLA